MEKDADGFYQLKFNPLYSRLNLIHDKEGTREYMFRLVRLTFLALLLIGIIGGTSLWLARVPLAEWLLSKKFKTDVTIENISFASKSVTLENLRLKNAPSSKLPFAFEAVAFKIQLHPLDLLKKEISIQLVQIQDPHLTIDLYNSEGNQNHWAPIISKTATTHNVSRTSSSERTYTIDRLNIFNLKIEIFRSGKLLVDIPTIPQLEFTDIGKNKAYNLTEILHVVLVRILEANKSKHHLGPLLEQLAIDNLNENSKFESAKNFMKEGVEAIKRKAQEAQEYLESLFSK